MCIFYRKKRDKLNVKMKVKVIIAEKEKFGDLKILEYSL